MWRHGDVLLAHIDCIPAGARQQNHTIVARGEVTGHAHRIAEPDAAELWELNGQLYIKVVAGRATLIHEEHLPITLLKGTYRVWMQREYTPGAVRRVVD